VTNREGAGSYWRRAAVIYEEAERLAQKGVWHLVVRRCQEAVELALKGALLWAGLEVPRLHDVGAILRRHADRFPPDFARAVPRLASTSRRLRAERELSFYGDEESGLPPEELYTADDAAEALAAAEEVLEHCRTLVGEGPA